MKKQIHIFVAMLATLFITLTASAQGEWKWAHYWSGTDGTYSDYYNRITNAAFDDEGNIYVYGTVGGDAVFDGLTFQYTTHPQVLSKNNRTILLAKFDTLGNMLWHKEMKSDNEAASPRWMEVRNNKVFVAADCGFYGYQSDSWLYYWDTLITRAQINSLPQELQKPPFQAFSRWTCLAQFDMDGNLLEDHFVQAYSRESFFNGSNWLRFDYTLCQAAGSEPTPVHFDNNCSYFIYTPIQYRGTENKPYTIIIDGDSCRTYDLYLPGNADSTNLQSVINNAMIYKFSQNGYLQFAKPIVHHTDGIASLFVLTGDSINKYFNLYYNSMAFDENDNMYLTGYVQLSAHLNGQGGELHDYPVHIWWDSTHYLTINDISSAEACPFIVKYDTNGNVLWCNQIYTRVPNLNTFAQSFLYGSSVYENSLFVVGDAEDVYNSGSIIYFEQNENNFIDRQTQDQQTRAFCVQFNKENGAYIQNTIVPNEKLSIFGQKSLATPAIKNNQVVISIVTDLPNKQFGLVRWNTNGQFIDLTYAMSYPNQMLGTGPTVLNDYGNVLVVPQVKGSFSLNEQVHVICSAVNSNAVFALYHNPEFTEPYVGLPPYSKQEQTLQIWPNPARNILNVSNPIESINKVIVTDVNGKILLQEMVEGQQSSINVSSLSSGMYFIKAVSEEKTYVEKFIKSSNY